MGVEWPDRRGDVVAALCALESEPVLSDEGFDQRWPDITNAVHWLVDDTGWDSRPPEESIGELLRHGEEAKAVRKVVDLVVAVSQRVGATASDAAWCSDAPWPSLQDAALAASSW